MFKSGMNFDCVGNVGKDYFECLIYGILLIATAISWMFSMYSFFMYLEYKRFLSIQQFIDNFRNLIGQILNNLRNIKISTSEFKSSILKYST
jgi:hypothetical protein